jgi:hypothetical protein
MVLNGNSLGKTGIGKMELFSQNIISFKFKIKYSKWSLKFLEIDETKIAPQQN